MRPAAPSSGAPDLTTGNYISPGSVMCTFSVAIDALLSNADVFVCPFPDIACASRKLDPYLMESGERQGDAAVCVIKSQRWKRTHCGLAFMGKMGSIHASITYSIIPRHVTCGLSSNTHVYCVYWVWGGTPDIHSSEEAQSRPTSEAFIMTNRTILMQLQEFANTKLPDTSSVLRTSS